jgi:16S rRNA (cytosine967-C5)-methyltransferase
VADDKEGFAARAMAAEALAAILNHGIAFDDALDDTRDLDPRDRSFLSAIVFTTLRHKETLDAVLAQFLTKPLPKKSGLTAAILLTAAAQLLYLDAPAYAVIDTAVTLSKRDRNAMHFAGLVNAILRKVAAEGKEKLSGTPPAVAPWLMARWEKAHGTTAARDLAAASLLQAPLDLTVKSDSASWAERLGGVALPTGTVRIEGPHLPVETLAGFVDGHWWVQDAASAIPAKLLPNIAGQSVLDLCAAPGGKTLQLAAAGAIVTAVDQSEKRLRRVSENLARTNLSATVVCADALTYSPASAFDAVLLDAPCSATGTIRRHPDLPYVKSPRDIGELVTLQRNMLTRASAFVKPGGLLVYCTCSLEAEEGVGQITKFLLKRPEFEIAGLEVGEAGLEPQMITREGYFRSLPTMAIGPSHGLDGFFAARLRRR